MFITNQKEQFSYAFVHALATVAGFKVTDFRLDEDSVDCTIVAPATWGTKKKAPRFDVQLKCTETDSGKGDVFKYDLKQKNYDDLRVVDLCAPKLLVLLCVPAAVDSWLKETRASTSLRRCAYWVSLRGFPEKTKATKTQTRIEIARANRFTVASLIQIMTAVSEEKPL